MSTQEKRGFSDFSSFQQFPVEVLREIVREGELEMQARLETANAADQRALTLVGFQITAATALIGATYFLYSQHPVDKLFLFLCIFEAIFLITAAYFGIDSAKPKQFRFPGNDPWNWNISDWHEKPASYQNAQVNSALAEQCYCLHTSLYHNRKSMEENAELTKKSVKITYWSAAIFISFSIIIIFLDFFLRRHFKIAISKPAPPESAPLPVPR
ncbi:hypothetical protein [Novosphingobium sp. NDB2Meth1]|uniref:hypothetical protein n=1 Tax=Novosphingobium sp. NDB2Meth1 TaxID=1892847 RepID=UPI0011600BE9|nr:hypothetical protein [Novosphingobium sp. NDB2Meth1]